MTARQTTDRPHPLSSLRAEEIDSARRWLAEAGVLGQHTRLAYLGLVEPDRAALADHRDHATALPRRARALLLDTATGDAEEVLVEVGTGALTRRRIDPIAEGQVPMLGEEHDTVRAVVAADDAWCAALATRGLAADEVYVAALSAGRFAGVDEPGRRIVRVLAHWRPTPQTMVWAHPVDGLVAYVDLIARRVVQVIDTGAVPVPVESGDYDDPALAGPARTDLRPIEITQPEGVSFTFDDDGVLSWQNWSLRPAFDMREGLVLHEIGYRDAGRVRPVVHRAAVAEMVVPYADPGPIRFWQNYFDTGEYQLGKLANALELGCDCLGEITYLDAVVTDDHGRPVVLPHAICIHEEDAGILWKHTDPVNGSRQVRRQRRLVVSFFATIGNYDYGFYWYFYLDGTIELECKATGVVFTAAHDERIAPYASELAPGLAAPYHQHLFNVRLDMAVDGDRNAVEEVEAARVPIGPDNPYGNAFTRRATRLPSERRAVRRADPATGRVWHVLSTEHTNRFGRPTGYALHPQAQPVLLADEASAVHGRAAFAAHHLWVTRTDPAQRFPAGELVNQSPPGAGLPAFVAGDRDLEGVALTLWHSFGLTHFPRLEDWPIMPVDRCGFTLRPVGFFDRNPTLDVPAPTGGHCCGGPAD